MSKELYMDAHEELIAEYLDENPDADEAEAYEATADGAYERMTDKLVDIADHAREQRKGCTP